MTELPPYLSLMLAEQRIPRSQLSTSSLGALRPLLAGGILELVRAGRGEVVWVRNRPAFEEWLRQRFPTFSKQVSIPTGATRAGAVALRRDSKAGNQGVQHEVLHLRAFGDSTPLVSVDGRDLPVVELTARHGVAACLITAHSVIDVTRGHVLLVENLECFLRAEALVAEAALVLNASGRVSERLVKCLARSQLGAQPLLYLPDYDPVGLSEYMRLREALGERVRLYVPNDLNERFERFGNRDLIVGKPRNRSLLEQLNDAQWPCVESAQVFSLIKAFGAGLEQEALLLNYASPPPLNPQ